jgi:Flp pilus assembly protein TadD
MKKTTITFLTAGLLFAAGLKAQTIQEGKNHLYAQRINQAIATFDKLIAANPNNSDAIYWLGQSYLESEEIMAARLANAKQLYQKAMQSTNGAPLITVGMGHIDLLENKTADARQKFETALTQTRTKKGDDPAILLAVGRANVDAKSGDYNYAIAKLVEANDKGEKSAESMVTLGDAYRKARPGEGGGDAFKSYKKALEINPNFALASLRLAKLFESQKNWELVLQYLNEATTKDPKFTAAYYDLFYYYFYRAKFDEADGFLKKFIESKLPDKEIQDEYLYAQLCWARKDFACATTKGESVVAALGAKTKPKVYRLLADAYYQKGDYANAKKYSDEFFAKKNPDDYISFDHRLRADIMSKTGGTPQEIYDNYVQGAELDTTVNDKVDFLKKASVYFKENKLREYEAKILEKLIALKPKPTINDYFDLALAYYFNQNNIKSREVTLKMIQLFPDQVYGYEWAYNNSMALTTDTLKAQATRDSMKLAIAGPDALKLYDFAKADTVKFKKQYINSVRFLAAYYINDAKDKEKSLEFFRKWLEADPANAEAIKKYIEQIEKMPAKPGAPKGATGGPRPPASPGAGK